MVPNNLSVGLPVFSEIWPQLCLQLWLPELFLQAHFCFKAANAWHEIGLFRQCITAKLKFWTQKNHPDLHHLLGGMKFATQISPLLDLLYFFSGIHSHIQWPRCRTSAWWGWKSLKHCKWGWRSDQRRVFGLRKIVRLLQEPGMRFTKQFLSFDC